MSSYKILSFSLSLIFALCGVEADEDFLKDTKSTTVTSSLLWSNSDPDRIYSSASISRNQGGSTIAIGTDFSSAGDQLAFVVNQSGVELFSLNCSADCSIYVDQARHPIVPSVPSVDTFILFTGSGDCVISGFYSSGPTVGSMPAWTTTLPSCEASEGVGGTYRCFEASDDGSTVALLGYGKDNGNPNVTSRAYALDGQTGEVRWTYDLSIKQQESAGQGDIWITTTGNFIAYINEDGVPTPNSAQMHILNGNDGTLRSEVEIPFFIAGAISDDGNYVAIQNFTHLKGSQGWVLKWDGTDYVRTATLNLPNDGFEYDEWDTAITVGDNNETIVVMGWISAPDVERLRVNSWNADSGDIIMDWHAPPNKQFQNNPSIMTWGSYIAVALWGDNGENPTVELMTVYSNNSLFEFTSPGSMFAIDLVVDSSTSTSDEILLVAAGKNVPANEGGTGGDAYFWSISVAK